MSAMMEKLLLMESKGFTLIEVLIALIILAIAFIAVIETSQTSIINSGKVKDALASHWVAIDVLSEIQLGLLPKPTSGGATSGEMQMLSQQWQWQAKVDQGSNEGFVRIAIEVSANGRRYQRLIGFINT